MADPTKLDVPPNGIADMLDSSFWLSTFSWNQLEALAPYFSCYSLNKNDVLFNEGEQGSSLYILVSGKILITKSEKELAVIAAGKSFGEMSLIDGEPRSAAASALSDCVLLEIDREHLETLAKEKGLLALKFYQRIATLLSQRLRHTSGMLADFLDN